MPTGVHMDDKQKFDAFHPSQFDPFDEAWWVAYQQQQAEQPRPPEEAAQPREVARRLPRELEENYPPWLLDDLNYLQDLFREAAQKSDLAPATLRDRLFCLRNMATGLALEGQTIRADDAFLRAWSYQLESRAI